MNCHVLMLSAPWNDMTVWTPRAVFTGPDSQARALAEVVRLQESGQCPGYSFDVVAVMQDPEPGQAVNL